MNFYKLLMCVGAALGLSACGGGNSFSPVITAVLPSSVQYSQTATIQLGGKHLRSYLQVDTDQACTNPSYAATSTTELLVLNCTVQRVGEWPLTVKDRDGQVIYATTVKVPKPRVALVTSLGNITLELDPAKAPLSVNNFLSYVRQGYYRNTLFHRVIAGFVVQGGGYTTGMVKKTGQAAAIALESQNGLPNLRGTLAMARTSVPDSATSEFFINLVDNPSLNYQNTANPGYAVFGTVVQGMSDVVDEIAKQTTGTVNGFADVPQRDVSITLAVQTQ